MRIGNSIELGIEKMVETCFLAHFFSSKKEGAVVWSGKKKEEIFRLNKDERGEAEKEMSSGLHHRSPTKGFGVDQGTESPIERRRVSKRRRIS